MQSRSGGGEQDTIRETDRDALPPRERRRVETFEESIGLVSVCADAPDLRVRSTDVVLARHPDRIEILLRELQPASARTAAPHRATVEATSSGNGNRADAMGASRDRVGALPRRRQRPAPTGEAGHVYVSCDPAGVLTLLSRKTGFCKRCMDVALAVVGLVVLSPLMLVIALAIKLTSPGPVLFVQQRTGRNLQRFAMLKFRTMRIGADRLREQLRLHNEMTGPLFKMDRDPRLTPIGGLLRRWSLDELPQLVNVLRGDMTLIGPRALSPLPSRYDRWHLARFEMTPGVACTWQASRRGDTDFDEWMRSDIRYVERGNSLWRDVRLLAHTLVGVLTRSGSR